MESYIGHSADGNSIPTHDERTNQKRNRNAGLAVVRAAEVAVLLFRVYADGNYWAGAGWEDDAVSDIDEGARRRKSGFAGNTRGRRECAAAAAGGTRQGGQTQEEYLCHRAACRFGRGAEGTTPR